VNHQTFFSILLVVLFFACTTENSHNKINPTILAKQTSYLELKKLIIEDVGLTDSIQVKILSLVNDSLKNHLMFDISSVYKSKDSTNFRFWNNQTFELSEKLNDSSKLAESNWDLASFFYQQNVSDSSYFYYNKAYNLYERIGYSAQSGSVLLNMALIQKDIKDFVGSEVTAISAIKKLEPLQLNALLYNGYNLLGVLNNELKEYDKALSFHQKALSYEEKFNNSVLKATSFNNIGVIYRNKKNYKKSLEYFRKAISIDSIYLQNSRLFAMLLENSAYSRFKLNDTIGLENDFLYALKIRDSIDHKAGMITNHLHLGEYYLKQSDTIKALDQIQIAKSLSEEYHNYGDLLESLLFLAKIIPAKSKQYYSKYIGLNDSLQNQERLIQNKFARIRFETDEFIAQNEQLNFQKRWIILGSSGLVFIIISVFVIIIQRKKNKELVLIQQQLKSNEEIYNLLIDSQIKIEEGREMEKNRISQELHDGVSSQLYAIRLNLESLNNKSDPASLIKRERFLEVMRKLEVEIRTITHDLKMNFFSSNIGFSKILEDLVKEQENIGKFKGNIIVDEEFKWDELTSKVKINLYRIIQEALHNINKYAEAKKVEVIFIRKDENVFLTIKDDGKGFDAKTNTTGIGINNMKSRIKDLNGQFTLKTGENGTSIEINVPKLRNKIAYDKAN